MATKTPNLDSYTELCSFRRGASRANEAGLRANDHLKRALSEIDGLLAGLSYLDETDPLTPRLGKAPADAIELELDGFLSRESPSEPATTYQNQDDNTTNPGPKTRSTDWSCIRNVRDGMNLQWQQFNDLASELNNDAINKIRGDYGNAKGLRETGVFAFRNTLTGPAPNDLRKVFAFTSLSYVVTCLLRELGSLPKEEKVLSGIQVWMNAIQDSKERRAFTILASHLWPEAKNYIHFFDLETPETKQTGATLRRDQWTGSSDSLDAILCQHMPPIGNDIGSIMPSANPYQPVAIPVSNAEPLQQGHTDIPDRNPTHGFLDHVYHVTDLTFDTVEFWQFLKIPGIDDGSSALPMTDQGGLPGLPPESGQGFGPVPMSPAEEDDATEDSSRPDSGVSVESLKKTQLFTVFSVLFKVLKQLCFVLSGQGMTAKDLSSFLAFFQEQHSIKDHIDEEFMRPLRDEGGSKDAPSQAIVSVASKFVNLGYLQTVEEVTAYMTIIGREIFDVDATAYQRFMEWILKPSRSTKSPSSPASSVHKPRRSSGGVVKKKAAVQSGLTGKRFFCGNCGKCFDRKYNMQRHEKIHYTKRREVMPVAPVMVAVS